MSISEKLQKRISLILGRSVEMPVRLYPGKHQRKAGGWVWGIEDNIGSCDTMAKCADFKNELSCSSNGWDIEFHAEERGNNK